MRSVLFVLTACAVIGLAFWAYRENYRTQQALDVTEQLQREIRDSRSILSIRCVLVELPACLGLPVAQGRRHEVLGSVGELATLVLSACFRHSYLQLLLQLYLLSPGLFGQMIVCQF